MSQEENFKEEVTKKVEEKELTPTPVVTKKEEEVKEETEVEETKVEKVDSKENQIKEDSAEASEEKLKEKNSWGRQDEFVELNSSGSISSGLLKRNSAQELGGLGVILKSETIQNGVHSEALVFVPGASVIDLYEDHENPNEISGRTLAKR